MPYKDPEKQRERNYRYYRANKERIKAYAKKWAADHYDRVLEKTRAWRKAHPDYQREYCREWKKRNRELVLQRERERKRRKRQGLTRKPSNPAEVAQKLLAKAKKLVGKGYSGKLTPRGI